MKVLDYTGTSHLVSKTKTELAKKVDKVTGKGLSTNDYTNAEKQKVADSLTDAPSDGKQYARQDGNWEELDLDGKANIDGYYDTLSVGLADNLIDRKGNGTPQEISYRTSCGDDSIADDGNGIIQSIFGKTVVDSGELISYNGSGIKTVGFNLFDENRLLEASGWSKSGGYYTGGIGSLYNKFNRNTDGFIRIPPEYSGQICVTMSGHNSGSAKDGFIEFIYADGTLGVDYSKGLPPTTDGTYTIVSAVGKKVVKVCFSYAYSSNLFIKSLNINLSWSGYRNGEYEPYWSRTLNLPISTYFPDGMKSAGNNRDEMTKDKATQRIGSRAYQSGDENDASVVTDMTTTYYPLAEPIETTITPPLDLTYKVADFGTEESIAEGKSTPFNGIIKYSDDFTRGLVNMPKNYDTTASLDALATSLSTMLTSALDGTVTITRGAYDSTNKKYAWNCSFTPNA